MIIALITLRVRSLSIKIEPGTAKKQKLKRAGGEWMDTPKGQRFSDIRLEQALTKGADIIALACPYCFLNYRDSMLSMGKEEVIQVKDVSELVAEAM